MGEMNLRGLILSIALAAGKVGAQNDTAIEIHGLVTEIGLGLGLAGAEVTVYEFAGRDRTKTLYATGPTDPRGEFRFHPKRYGDYWVEVRKPAYVASIPIEGPASLKPPAAETGTLITVSSAHPSQEVGLR
jgi:hypothetical protein